MVFNYVGALLFPEGGACLILLRVLFFRIILLMLFSSLVWMSCDQWVQMWWEFIVSCFGVFFKGFVVFLCVWFVM